MEQSRKLIAALMSLIGYMATGSMLGYYLDQKYFHNGVAIIIGILGGICLVTIEFIMIIRKGIKSDASN